MRHPLIIGTSALALATVANAQSTAGPADTTPVPAGLADIIITATKVESTLQRTPQAITSIAGETLLRAGVTGVQALNKLVGGLQVEQNGSNAAIYIRGVGSRTISPDNDPGVAFSVDGVYFARSAGIGTTLFDVARVEVVKGPQGTLYGRNATGGAVNVISTQPKLGKLGVDGEIEVGNYAATRFLAAVNVPLGDNAAFRLAGQAVNHHGYLSDGTDDEDTRAVRASLAFKPSAGFSLFVSADYAHQGGQGAGTVPIGPGGNNDALTTRFVVPDAPYTGGADPRVNAFLARAAPASAIPVPLPGVYCVGIPFPPGVSPPVLAGAPALLTCANPLGVAPIDSSGFLRNEFYGANVTAQIDAGIGDLTAIAGYRATEIDTRFRSDVAFQQTVADVQQYSGELRLASKPDHERLKWLVGAFYLKEDQAATLTIPRSNAAISNPVPAPGSPLPATTCVGPLDPDGPGPAPAIPGVCLAQATVVQSNFVVANPDYSNQSYAGFGQATFAVVEGLRLTGGVRYTHEDKRQSPATVMASYTLPAGVTTTYISQGEVTYTKWSYRAGVDVDLGPRSLLYATYSTAFHAGGFNLGVRQGPNAFEYKPEEVKSYVVGSKNRFLHNRLQINVEGFWLDYANYQQNNFGRVNDGSVACSTLAIQASCPLTLRVENAATARIRGVEGDIIVQPMPNTTINLNILYNDAKFITFRLTDVFSGNLAIYDGRRLPGTVPWTLTGGISQAFPLANGGQIVADVHSQFKTGAYLWFTYGPSTYQTGYTRTDLSLTYEAPNTRFSVTGFVRNVENSAALLQGGPTDATTGVMFTNLIAPRTFGAIFGFHF